MANEIKVDYVLDAKGELCPMPVIKARQAIDRLAPGQVLQLLATDPGSKLDVPAWARTTNHRLLEVREEGGVFVFFVEN